ncbi:MAG: hypothetical protein EHM93_05595 [Bacteroidales bacterium]|nr:MAG: hypothetical protein EHM93_05595 [Bacteroidales bacterium]
MEKTYAVVIGADRISTSSDIDQIKGKGLLAGVTSVLDLQINMGANRQAEVQSSNIAFMGQYQKLAAREFGMKNINKQPSEISISKHVTFDGALFIVAK